MSYATPRADDRAGASARCSRPMPAPAASDAGLAAPQRRQPGRASIGALGRAARVDAGVHGVPARVLPLEVWHTASVGIDLWLAAIAYGATQVWVLMTDEEAPEYRGAVRAQMAVAQAIARPASAIARRCICAALDRRRGRCSRPARRALQALTGAAASARRRSPARVSAAFSVQADKRATLDLAIEHLLAAGAAARRGDRAAGAPAARSAACCRHRRLHAVPELRRRLPGSGAGRQPRPAAAALHREELRAVRAVREHLPRGCDHARAAAVACRRPARRASRRACSTRSSRTAASAAASRSAR